MWRFLGYFCRVLAVFVEWRGLWPVLLIVACHYDAVDIAATLAITEFCTNFSVDFSDIDLWEKEPNCGCNISGLWINNSAGTDYFYVLNRAVELTR